MQELEVKIFEIDKDFLIKEIEGLGGTKISEGEIIADFFINNDNKKIRLRRINNKNILTYKEKIKSDGVMENLEYEIEFDNYNNLENILNLIGFNKYGKSSKYRIAYSLNNVIYDFDKYEGIPRFVEVEATNIDDLKKGVELIGYNMQDTNTLTERQVKEHYGIK